MLMHDNRGDPMQENRFISSDVAMDRVKAAWPQRQGYHELFIKLLVQMQPILSKFWF